MKHFQLTVKRRRVRYLCFLLCFQFFLTAQEFPFKELEHIGNQYGLINNYISDIVKDNKGRYWLGSLNGLLEFDGFKTRLIKLPKVKDGLVISNSISRLYLENDTLLWIGQTYGVCYMNLKTGEIVPVKMKKESPTQSLIFYFIVKDQAGDVWLSTRELGLQRLNRKNFRFDKTGEQLIDKKERVYDYQFLDDTYITFSHGKSVSVYNTKTKKLELKTETANPFYYLSEDLFLGRICSSLIKEDKVYFGRRVPGETGYSFFAYDRKTKDTTRYEISSIMGRKFFEDSRGNIWIYNEGLAVIEKSTGKLYQTDTDDNYGFSMCNRIYEDNEGNIWFCTNYGLFVYHLDNADIVNFSERIEGKPVGHIFTDLVLTKDSLLVFTTFDDGILVFNKDFSFKEQYRFIDKNTNTEERLSRLSEDADSIIWIGCVFGKVIRFDIKSGKHEFFSDPCTEMSRIMAIHCLKSGHVLLLTQNGRIIRFDKKQKKFEVLYNQSSDKDSPIDYINNSFLLDDSLLIIGTVNKGLFTYHLRKGIKKSYVMNPSDPHSIESNVITDISGFQGKVIVSHESGLDVFDPVSGKFSRLLKGKDVAFSECYSFVQTGAEEIAVNTSDGLYKINTVKGTYFRVGRGTILDKSNYRLLYLENKKIFIFSSDSYLYHSKNKAASSGIKPECYLYTVESKDTVVNFDAAEGKIELRRDQNTVRITLGSNTFRYKGYIEYYYRIENETDWINIKDNREILFNNLRGGDYTIHVKCLNKESNIFSDEIVFRLIIRKAFYETGWFYVFLTLLVLMIIYLIYRIRINKLLAVERVRFKLSRDLHDDMGSTLSTINILSGMVKTKLNKDPSSSSEYIDKISSYSQEMMESMNDIVWSLNPSNDSMLKVISKMREFATNILEPKNINFRFNISGDPEKFSLKMESRRDFFLIFKETINNAAKYSGADLIEVNLILEKDRIILNVRDNGKGFRPEEKDKGNGHGNMRRRAAAIGGNITIHSAPGEGCFTELIVNRS